MASTLRVATVNILNDLSRWGERRPLLVAGLRGVAADVVALQEVVAPLGESTAHQLAADLGGFAAFAVPKAGWARRFEGIALLSRLPVERHEAIDLGSQGRVAQVAHLRVGGRAVAVANGHLAWPPGAHATRARQVGRILDHLDGLGPTTALVACGDFNGLPGSAGMAAIGRRLASAHRACHGVEPAFTCPTPLVGRGRIRAAASRAVLGLFSNRPDGPWRGTVDYIFVGAGVRVVEAGVFLDRPAAADPTLYASDHLGVHATLAIPPP